MTCKTCKYWQPLPNEPPCYCDESPCACKRLRAEPLSGGMTVPWAPNSGVCSRAAMAYDDADPFNDALMFVQDGSDYRACLVTKAEFFCAHYQEAE